MIVVNGKKKKLKRFTAYKRHTPLPIWSTELEHQQQPTTHINKPHPPTAHQLATTTSIAQRPAGSSAANSASNKEKSSVPRRLGQGPRREMEKAGHEHVIGIPVNNRAFGIEEPDFPSNGAAKSATAAGGRAAKFGRTGDRVAQGLKEHGKSFSDPTKSRMLPVSPWIRLSVSETERALAR